MSLSTASGAQLLHCYPPLVHLPQPSFQYVNMLGKAFDAKINYKRELMGLLFLHRIAGASRADRFCFICFLRDNTITAETRLKRYLGKLWCPNCIKDYFICKSAPWQVESGTNVYYSAHRGS